MRRRWSSPQSTTSCIAASRVEVEYASLYRDFGMGTPTLVAAGFRLLPGKVPRRHPGPIRVAARRVYDWPANAACFGDPQSRAAL
jgi:hypothetical protein